MILLVAEVQIKKQTNRLALGTVIEARLDKTKKGPIATLLVQEGTLKVRDPVVGTHLDVSV